MKTLAYSFSLFCAMSLVFGTILMIGGNHIGDFIIVCSAIGAIACLYCVEGFKSKGH
jgi:hypothetical protein